MVFNGDSDNQDLCTLADLHVKTDDTDFPLAEKAIYANMGLREIFSWIWSAYGGWESDDNNNSGEPEVITNLVTTARNVYPFATAQAISEMSYKDSSGTWYPLKPITIEEITAKGYAETEFMKTAGKPIYYRPVNNGVRLYPDSDTAVSSGLKARIRRDISAFTSASTSTSPGFDSNLHEGLAIFMSLKFAKINNLDSAVALQVEWDGNEAVTGIEGGFKRKVKRHYGEKFRQHFPQSLKGGSSSTSNIRYIEGLV